MVASTKRRQPGMDRTEFRQQVVDLAKRGVRPKIIALDLGSTMDSVKVILCQERRVDPTIPRFDPAGNIRQDDVSSQNNALSAADSQSGEAGISA
jgi:hypothetical protein